MTPDDQHAAVLTALDRLIATATAAELPAIQGRRRILERHEPESMEARLPWMRGEPHCSSCLQYGNSHEIPWPCIEYRDAAAGLGVLDDTEGN